MAAGNFRPQIPSLKERFGKQRSTTAKGKMGWSGATNVWVDVRAFIWSFDGNAYDITDDIISGTLSRNTDQPTNLSITFANDGDKYRQMFIPKDRIVVWLRRNETEWQSFTGYVQNVPVFNTFSYKEITLECQCIIRRIIDKMWDPAARENIYALASPAPKPTNLTPETPAAEGEPTDPNAPVDPNAEPAPPATEGESRGFRSGEANAEDNPATPDVDESLEPDPNAPVDPNAPPEGEEPPAEPEPGDQGAGEMITPDMTLAFLLTAPDHIGLKPENVLIQKFPEAWIERAATITSKNRACASEWSSLIVCPDDKTGNCAEPGAPGGGPGGAYKGGPITDFPGEDASQGEIACWMATNARARGLPGELPVTVSLHEHRGTMRNVPQDGCTQQGDEFVGFEGCAGGYFQQTPPFWGTASQVMDPPYALNAFLDAAQEFKGQYGEDCQGIADWGQAVQKAGVVGDMVGFCEQAKELLAGCGESSIGNMAVDASASENACDESNWDPTASGPTTHNHSPLIQSIIDDVTSKWNTFTNTYPGHPGGEENAVDFWGPNDRGDDLAAYAPMGDEIYNHLISNYGNQINWIIWNGQMTDAGGTRPDPSGFGHYDHIHITAGSNDCGGGTIGGGAPPAGGGTGFNPDGTPCGSGTGSTPPAGTEPTDPNAEPTDPAATPTAPADPTTGAGPAPAPGGNSIGYGRGRSADAIQPKFSESINPSLLYFIRNGRRLEGTPFRWGGGHGMDLELGNLEARGVDASGLFNYLRQMQNLSPAEVGAIPDYFRFLEDVRAFDKRRNYPIGTVLINPGQWNIRGHMGMVVSDQGHVLEANASGRVTTKYKISESNRNWAGYTHVGVMPDLPAPKRGIVRSHATHQEVARNDNLNRKIAASRSTYVADKDKPRINFCQTHGEAGVDVELDWDLVGDDKILYYKISGTQFESYFNEAVQGWNSIGGETGVKILPATSGGRVDMEVKDGDRPEGVMATTGYEGDYGYLEFDPDMMNSATDNARRSVAYHEVGHALRLAHTPDGTPSIMKSSVDMDSSENIDAPTEYDIGEYRNVWGGDGTFKPGGPGGAGGPGAGGPTSGSSNYVDQEHCITKHPYGVYKLAQNAINEASGESTHIAEVKRFLALNNGDMVGAKAYSQENFETDAFYDYPQIWDKCEEDREWRHLAELYKEPYLPTIQDVSDSGMYTMMSIGTGEIVFWYPWIVEKVASDVAKTDEEKAAEEEEKKEAVVPADDSADDLISYSKTSLSGSLRKRATEEIQESQEMRGMPMGETNAHVLTDKFLLTDTDLIDFSIYVSDDPLVTHYFVLGEYRLEGGSLGGIPDLQCWRWSTIFDHPVLQQQANMTAHFDPFAFIQRYGVRSKSETVKAIKTPGMAQIWAEQQFLKHWLNCYMIQLKTTFLPEIYPGTRLQIESLGVEVIVEQANHTFGAEWSTQLTVSMPLAITDESRIPPLPFWTLLTTAMVNEGMNSEANPDDPYLGAPLEISGDLWESIEEKRKADNERVRQYLEGWLALEEFGFDKYEEWLDKNPAPGIPEEDKEPDPPSTTVPGENGPITLPTAPSGPPTLPGAWQPRLVKETSNAYMENF